MLTTKIVLYAYVGGNPISFTDPRGTNPVAGAIEGVELGTLVWPGVGTVVGGLVGAGVGWWAADKLSHVIFNSGDKDPSTPTGQRGSPIDVEPGTNAPCNIGGRDYTGHSVDRMQGRGVPPSAVEDAIRNGATKPGNTPGTTVHSGSNGVTVVTGSNGQVITVIPR